MLALAVARLRRDLERNIDGDPVVTELLDRVVSREIDPATAARELLEYTGDD